MAIMLPDKVNSKKPQNYKIACKFFQDVYVKFNKKVPVMDNGYCKNIFLNIVPD